MIAGYKDFVFWGLFLVFAVIIILYYFWMKAENRKDQ